MDACFIRLPKGPAFGKRTLNESNLTRDKLIWDCLRNALRPVLLVPKIDQSVRLTTDDDRSLMGQSSLEQVGHKRLDLAAKSGTGSQYFASRLAREAEVDGA